MSEDADLQARIAALTGRINQHRQPPGPSHTYHAPRHHPYQRWSPYARGGIHKNRSLVINNNVSKQSDPAQPSVQSTTTPPSFVTTQANGTKQLMTKTTYEREQKQKQEYQEQRQRPVKKPKVSDRVERKETPSTNQQKHTLVFDGIQFSLLNDGSKLVRVSDPATDTIPTPKSVKVADIDFFRTKRGNLIRGAAARPNASVKPKTKPQCEHFTKHGTCPFGPSCNFTHDPTKTAICKDFLRHGTCPAGTSCDLSHTPTYHRVSACSHFVRGNCTNPTCRYPHVHVGASAPVCRAFATLGYCGRGEKCERRHVVECPDYANHGRCVARGEGRCTLPHVDRASALRKAAERVRKTTAAASTDNRVAKDGEEGEEVSDVSSSSGDDGEDGGDESELDVEFDTGEDRDSAALAQQRDFIAF